MAEQAGRDGSWGRGWPGLLGSQCSRRQSCPAIQTRHFLTQCLGPVNMKMPQQKNLGYVFLKDFIYNRDKIYKGPMNKSKMHAVSNREN